ncbi:MAG: hypothetical protein ACYCTV_02580 [Leptospirales bacterium]
MFLFEIRHPNSHFGPPFPPRKAFERLFKELGPYQGLFYQKKRLILHSPPVKGLWPAISHGQTWEHFLDYLKQIIPQGERSHYDEFLRHQENLTAPFSDKFILKSGVIRDFSFLGLYIYPTAFGYHIALTPASSRREIETIHQTYARLNLDPSFEGLSLWIREMEIEQLVSLGMRTLPDPFRKETTFHRVTEYRTTEGSLESANLLYLERNDTWIREIFEGEKPSSKNHSHRIQARMENGDIHMKITFFVGQVFPLFWASIGYRALEKHSLAHFYDFVRSFSDQSVLLAQEFSSDSFRFSKYWTGQGYEMESLLAIAQTICQDPLESLIIPVWGLNSNTLEIIRKTSRLSDPLFLDLEKGLAAILLRGCTRENARNIVFHNLSRQLGLPIEPPLTLEEFIHMG